MIAAWPSGREVAGQYGRHERWGRLVKRSGTAGEFSTPPSEPALHLILAGKARTHDRRSARTGLAASQSGSFGCGDGEGVVTEAGDQVEPSAQCLDVAGDGV